MDINLTLLGQTIAMIFFVWFTMKFIWPPIMSAIEARQVAIADGLAAAERGQSDLAQAKTEAEKIVAAAREQARGIVDQASSRANDIVEAAKSEGEAEKQRRLDSARSEIEVEINRARDELRAQVAAIAIAGAERVLAREIDANAHRDLLDRLAADL
ncbi:MAG: F0F1 ATP synthase subunit B [Gammaproteobacteria bacterium]|nr:F0F1 ATP synthase subunit B [Gammaproteobacteria bacterium]